MQAWHAFEWACTSFSEPEADFWSINPFISTILNCPGLHPQRSETKLLNAVILCQNQCTEQSVMLLPTVQHTETCFHDNSGWCQKEKSTSKAGTCSSVRTQPFYKYQTMQWHHNSFGETIQKDCLSALQQFSNLSFVREITDASWLDKALICFRHTVMSELKHNEWSWIRWYRE